MRKPLLLFLAFFIITVSGYSQQTRSLPCDEEQIEIPYQGNDIRTIFSNSGSMFVQHTDGIFHVPPDGRNAADLMNAMSLWVAGIDLPGNLKLAAQTFPYLDLEYGPGPLDSVGVTCAEKCKEWNRVWSVVQNDVRRHQQDYNDDGTIQDTIPAIFAWPGAGNMWFRKYNGIDLIDREFFGAPFNDLNSNGVYEPHLGEYPHPENIDDSAIPMRIDWTVFNDNSKYHDVTNSDPVLLEVQLTTYTFSCGDDLLDRTIFNSYRVTKPAGFRQYPQGVYLGLWMSPKIGCPVDDGIGSYPEGNTMFTYNRDSYDGTPGIGCPELNFADHPPAVSLTFLNTEMTSCSYYHNSAVGNFPNGMTEPIFGLQLSTIVISPAPGRTAHLTQLVEPGTMCPRQIKRSLSFPMIRMTRTAGPWSPVIPAVGDRHVIASTWLPITEYGAGIIYRGCCHFSALGSGEE